MFSFCRNGHRHLNGSDMAYDGKAIMFDMDGVLYRGTSGLPRAGEVVEWVRTMRMWVGFITNNSTRTLQTFQENTL